LIAPRARISTGNPRVLHEPTVAARFFSHGDDIVGTRRYACGATAAPIIVAQRREFLPTLLFERQQVQVAGGDAPAAAGTACSVDLRKGGAFRGHLGMRR
jgi:hypothetical protein